MLPTLGIDISKDSFHVELSVNEKLRHRKFANRKEGFAELCVWLAKHKTTQVHACLEATGPYSEDLALYLHQQGHTVSIVNPAQIQSLRPKRTTAQQGRSSGCGIDPPLL